MGVSAQAYIDGKPGFCTIRTLEQATRLGTEIQYAGPLPTTLNVPVGISYVSSTLYVVDATENSVLAIDPVY